MFITFEAKDHNGKCHSHTAVDINTISRVTPSGNDCAIKLTGDNNPILYTYKTFQIKHLEEGNWVVKTADDFDRFMLILHMLKHHVGNHY